MTFVHLEPVWSFLNQADFKRYSVIIMILGQKASALAVSVFLRPLESTKVHSLSVSNEWIS